MKSTLRFTEKTYDIHISNRKRYGLTTLILFVFSLFAPIIGRAATVSGETGNIITLSLRDYSSLGSTIYNELLDGSLIARNYSWTSSNESVTTWRTRNANYAYVTFSKPGTYTVNYTLNYTYPGGTKTYNFSGTWTVYVTQSGPTGITVSAGKTTIYEGETTIVSASIQGGTGSITWTQSNYNVSLNKSGSFCTVTGASAGSTKITATTNNGYSDYVYITVIEHNKVVINPSLLNLNVGDEETISANITGYNSSTCNWTTSNPEVVSIVNASGKNVTILAKSEGIAQVTATAYDGTTDTCTVYVSAPEPKDNDLYITGDLTNWKYLDDFKFTPSGDGKTYYLYLDYLAEEFLISSKDGKVTYGDGRTWTYTEENVLTKGGSPMNTYGPYITLYITFDSETGLMTIENKNRPILPGAQIHLLYFCTNPEGGVMGIPIIEGARQCFGIETQDGWEAKSWLISDDVNVDDILYDYTNDFYVSPVITAPAILGVYFEKETLSSPARLGESRARLQMTKESVRIIDIPDGVDVNVANSKGMLIGHYPHAVSTIELPITRSDVYVISLSNGQQFKVFR